MKKDVRWIAILSFGFLMTLYPSFIEFEVSFHWGPELCQTEMESEIFDEDFSGSYGEEDFQLKAAAGNLRNFE